MLQSLNIVSNEYKLVPMMGQLSNDDEDRGLVTDLAFQERTTLHYRLATIDQTAAPPTALPTCSVHQFAMTDCVSMPATDADSDVVDFLCLGAANARFKAALDAFEAEAANGEDEESQPRHVSQIRRAKTNANDGDDSDKSNVQTHPTSLSRLCPKSTQQSHLELVCSWGNKDTNTHGQTHVMGLSVRPKEASRGCPITITCQFPPKVQHNFAKGPAVSCLQ